MTSATPGCFIASFSNVATCLSKSLIFVLPMKRARYRAVMVAIWDSACKGKPTQRNNGAIQLHYVPQKEIVPSQQLTASPPADAVRLPIHPTHAEILHDEVVLDPVLRTFASDAGFLDPAEGRDFGGNDPGVDADDAVFERLGDAPDAADVAAVEVRGQPELGVVSEADRLLLVLEAKQRRDGAKGFFFGHLHRRVDVREHGRLEERSAERVALAAHEDFRALRDRVRDVFLYLRHRGLVDERTLHDAGLHAVADLHGLHLFGELRGERVVDFVLHEQPVGAHAGLTGVSVLGSKRPVDR